MKILYLVVSLFLCTINVSSASIAISERIGEEINRYERDYFFLFPSINGFEKAVLVQDENSYIFKINYRDSLEQKDTSIRISEEILKDLKFYIEEYERVVNNDDWNSIKKVIKNIYQIALPKFSFLRYEDIEIINSNGLEEEYSCFFLLEDFIVVSEKGENYYNWKKAKNFSFIHYSEINYFISPFKQIIGKNKKYFDISKEKLAEESKVFNQVGNQMIPPELTDIFHNKEMEFSGKVLPTPITDDDLIHKFNNSFNFEVSTNFQYTTFGSDYTYDCINNYTTWLNRQGKYLYFGNDYYLNLCLGLSYKFHIFENSFLNIKADYLIPFEQTNSGIDLIHSYNAGLEYVYGFGYIPNSFLFSRSEFFAKLSLLYSVYTYEYPLIVASTNKIFKSDIDISSISTNLSLVYQLKVIDNFFLCLEPKLIIFKNTSTKKEIIDSDNKLNNTVKHIFNINYNTNYIASLSLGFLYRINF